MDYFEPILKRILAVTREFQYLSQTTQDVIKQSDIVSGDVEEFLGNLELAHKANVKAYESGVKVSTSYNRLEADISKLHTMTDATEKLASTGSMALMVQEVVSQNYIEVATKLHQLAEELYPLLFKELSTYDRWSTKGPMLLAELDHILHAGEHTTK